ncbi:MAG: PDZ domain-containing protein, partial [Thermoanaerobaculia bacterium]
MRWAFLALAVVATLGMLRVASEVRFAGRRIGISIDVAERGGLVVLDTAAGSPAERAGLRAGDRMLSLEGQPLYDTADFDHVAERARGGNLRLEAERQGGTFETTLTPGMPVAWQEVALGLLVVALYSALGLLAATRASEDRRATLLAAFSFAVAFELALPAHFIAGSLSALARAVAFALVTGLQFGLELHLAASIPTTLPWLLRRPGLIRVPSLVGLAVGGFAALAAILDGIDLVWAAPLTRFADALLETWMLPVWALAVTVLIGWRVAVHPEPRGRHQAALVLLGLLPWVGVVMWETATTFGAPLGAVPDLVWSLALLVYPVAIFAAIFLYRLFDLEWVVRKTFLYGALTSMLVLGFYMLVGAGGALFARQFDGGSASLWVVSTATLAMGLLFNPLRQRLEELIDRKIFPERQALRSRLVALAAELPAQGKLPRMGEHLARELARILAVEPVTLWIAAPPAGQLVELASAG